MKINNTFKLIIAIVVSELAGIIGSVFTTSSITGWYAGIVKPAINPPAWVFGPVWTTLFALMGIAAFLIWRKGLDRRDVKIALGVFVGQLALNTLWSIIFFGLHSPGGALVEIVFLWLAILVTIVAFAKISRPAAWLLLPYILWVSFAGYLNYSIWQLNSAGSGQVACTQEAKLCSDGSYVGRTGPKCEFTACPGVNNDLLKTATENGVTFQYPETLLTTYIHTQDWPPQVQVLNKPFTCTEAGSETARAGKTEKRLVDNRGYCRTSIVEGAAGSIYTQYAYAFPKDGKTAIFTFSLRAVQCANYDDPQKTVCENERSAFDLDSTVDRMARTLQFEQTVPKTISSGVRGTVLLGPTCPVVQNPPDPRCADKPYQTRLVITTSDQSKVIKEFSSDADGKFYVQIPPGKYAIRTAAAANILPYCAHDAFNVEADTFTDITVSCDTGIR